MAEIKDVVLRIHRIMEKIDMKYVIVGGFAAIIMGEPRSTSDIDLIIEKDIEKINKLLSLLEENDFGVMYNQIKMAFRENSNASIFDIKSILRLDLKIATRKDEIRVLNTAQTVEYQHEKIKIASLEEILYGKILYMGDISDLEQREFLEYNDIRDFLNVYKQNKGNINMNWLEEKVKEKGLKNTFSRLIKFLETHQI